MKSRKDWLIFLSHPYIAHTHTHAHTHIHTRSHTHTCTGKPWSSNVFIFWGRMKEGEPAKTKNWFKRLWGTEVSAVSFFECYRPNNDTFVFVCLFRNQKLITSRWVIAILCLFLILSKLKSITLDYVSFICQPSSYPWRKTVLNHCGFFGLPFMSLLHEAHGKELTRFLNAWN